MLRRPPRSTLFPTRRSSDLDVAIPRDDADDAVTRRCRIGRRNSVARTPLGGGRTAVVQKREQPGLHHLPRKRPWRDRSEEHTSELQSQSNLVCRLLLEKKKK